MLKQRIIISILFINALPLLALNSFEPYLNEYFQSVLDEQIYFSGQAGTSVTIESLDGRYWSGVSGTSDIIKGEKMKINSRFRMGSNTKSIVMTIIMQLAQEKKLSLDDTISKYYPEYTNWRNIKIIDLLGMKSGIPDYIQDKLLWLVALAYPHRYFCPYELLSYVKKEKLLFEPGTKCSYSNTNFILLGLIAQKVTGTSIKELINERIIKPLSLLNTYLDEREEKDPFLSHGYIDFVFAGPFIGFPDFLTKMVSKKIIIGDNIIDGTYLFNNSLTWTAGSIVSSNSDLVTFFKNLFTLNLVSSNSLEKIMTFTSCRIFNRNIDYGLTIMKRNSDFGNQFGHGGLYSGYRTETYYIPDKEIILSQSCNFLPDQPSATQYELINAIINPPKNFPSEKKCKFPNLSIPKIDNVLSFRFSGRLNDSDNKKSGISNFTFYSSGKRIIYYGLESFAKLFRNEKRIVEIESLAPSHTTSILKLATLSISMDSMENGKELQYLEIKDPSKVSISLYEAYLNEKKLIEKLCITGITDYEKGGEIFICQPEELNFGNKIKLIGYSIVETNMNLINEKLKKYGLKTCFCIDEFGKPKNCYSSSRENIQKPDSPVILDFINPFVKLIDTKNLFHKNIINEKIMSD